MSTLHITNGDSTVELLRAAEITGDKLPWRDVLHMGPVPSGCALRDLSVVRASFIASLAWGEKKTLLADFQRRDDTLESATDYDHILLWFEHDLYDQLQLLQLLDWFNQRAELQPKLALINPNKHLGYHTVEEVPALFAQQKPVTNSQLMLATAIWDAFTQPTPEQLALCLHRDLSALQHLRAAILRTLGELPAPDSGLNQTETSILTILDDRRLEGSLTKIELFREYNRREAAAFQGDMGFLWSLDQLLNDAPQWFDIKNDTVALTPEGKTQRHKPVFWRREYTMQHWLGGYAIGREQNFYWDTEKHHLSKYPC